MGWLLPTPLLLPLPLGPTPTATTPPLAIIPVPTPIPALIPRQEASIYTSGSLFPTVFESPTTTYSSSIPSDPAPTVASPVPPHEWITTSRLEVETEPVKVAGTMGLVMPEPWQEAFVEVQYTLGFVDAVQRPAPVTGGWIRIVTPLLIFPDYTVNVFPSSGPANLSDQAALPAGSEGLCGASVEDFSIGYPYMFHRPGWYMYVVNQTWLQPTIVNSTCQLPIVSQRSFFATQPISLAALPTAGAYPAAPSSAYTVFAPVSPHLPGPLPLESHTVGAGEKLGIGLGVAGGVLAFLAGVGGFLYVRSRRKAQREIKAFNRLKPHEQYQFLLDNPNHFLNPNRPGRRVGYITGRGGGVDAWGRPMGWMRQWSRWGQAELGSGQALGGGWGLGRGWPWAPGGQPRPDGMGQLGHGAAVMPHPSSAVGGDMMRQVYPVPPSVYPGYPHHPGMGGGIIPPLVPDKDPRLVWSVPTQAYR